MKIILSHPTGNANVRATAEGLLKANLLSGFHTTIASFPGSFLDRAGSISALSEIRRRNFDKSLQPITTTWPWIEIGRLVASKIGFRNLINHEGGPFSIDNVYKSLDKNVAQCLKGNDAVYAYEDGAAFSFKAARKLGLQCFYDLPIGYWKAARMILEEEKKHWPEWATTLTGFKDAASKLERKDDELKLADRIFVASQFTAKTLQQFDGPLAPIQIIPYGFPPVYKERSYSPTSGKNFLKLLFVGGLSQRKGIANLFKAAEKLKDYVELTIVGHKVNNDCPALDAALSKHRWIPSLPHHEVLKLMREHDVLIFPSLFEGFGLVITEAMSQGTPVITTDRTAGPDFIENGRNGWLVEAGSTPALQAAIEELLYHPGLAAQAGQEAIETAKNRPWEVYGMELVQAIKGHLDLSERKVIIGDKKLTVNG